MTPLFGFFEFALSPSHILIILIAGVVLFGKRLPEIGRYVGKGIVEFKKGLKGLEDEFDGTAPRTGPVAEQLRAPQRLDASVSEVQRTSHQA